MWSGDNHPKLHQSKRARTFINPYILKLADFPGRLFSFDGPETEDEALRCREAITRAAKRYVEFGSGSGGHLIALAAEDSMASYFGFELRFKRAVRTIQKADRLGRENVYVLCTAAERVQDFFPPESVSGIFVNFPDPWEKPKRQKHRLLRKEFLDVAEQLLVPEGFISFKTDHEEYFDTFRATLNKDPRYQMIHETRDLYSSEFLTGNIATEFERLFISQQLPIYYLRAMRL